MSTFKSTSSPKPSTKVRDGWDIAVTGGGLTPVFQSIVSLPDGATVGFEALARWPELGCLSADAVFAHVAAYGREQQLEKACIDAALQAALSAGVGPATMMFINCEPTTRYVDRAHNQLLASGAENLQIVFELTERSLLTDPPALLRKVNAIREDGFAVALDDVGANLDSLALLDVISPDVIKLDLALVQSRPRYQQARTWAAVLAHHERAGAVVLAEGIETAEHLQRALSLGATLGQGFLFGHPGPLPIDQLAPAVSTPPARTQRPWRDAKSPFDAVVAGQVPTRTERKDTVVALSRYVERQALEATDPPMVLTAVQRAEFFTGPTQRMYRHLGTSSPLVAVFGPGLAADLGAGVRGVSFDTADPLSSQWIVLTLGVNTATALIAREHDDNDVHHRGDADRLFEVAITHDRTLVSIAARNLLSRMT
ncbi:MAG: EAL domain-containing protein [Actinomycetota bacterium]|nr:EAL domain-containing protein [Actinomycetota bacterium]